MSSCGLYFKEGLERFGVDRRIDGAKSWNERRRISTVLMGSDGAMVSRVGAGKSCLKCGERFEGCIFVHRVLLCESFERARIKGDFVIQIANLPVECRKTFFRRRIMMDELEWLIFV